MSHRTNLLRHLRGLWRITQNRRVALVAGTSLGGISGPRRLWPHSTTELDFCPVSGVLLGHDVRTRWGEPDSGKPHDPGRACRNGPEPPFGFDPEEGITGSRSGSRSVPGVRDRERTPFLVVALARTASPFPRRPVPRGRKRDGARDPRVRGAPLRDPGLCSCTCIPSSG